MGELSRHSLDILCRVLYAPNREFSATLEKTSTFMENTIWISMHSPFILYNQYHNSR
jgi:hypothetical protein